MRFVLKEEICGSFPFPGIYYHQIVRQKSDNLLNISDLIVLKPYKFNVSFYLLLLNPTPNL